MVSQKPNQSPRGGSDSPHPAILPAYSGRDITRQRGGKQIRCHISRPRLARYQRLSPQSFRCVFCVTFTLAWHGSEHGVHFEGCDLWAGDRRWRIYSVQSQIPIAPFLDYSTSIGFLINQKTSQASLSVPTSLELSFSLRTKTNSLFPASRVRLTRCQHLT